MSSAAGDASPAIMPPPAAHAHGGSGLGTVVCGTGSLAKSLAEPHTSPEKFPSAEKIAVAVVLYVRASRHAHARARVRVSDCRDFYTCALARVRVSVYSSLTCAPSTVTLAKLKEAIAAPSAAAAASAASAASVMSLAAIVVARACTCRGVCGVCDVLPYVQRRPSPLTALPRVQRAPCELLLAGRYLIILIDCTAESE